MSTEKEPGTFTVRSRQIKFSVMADTNLALEHKVIQPLKAHSGGSWLLAVSGGLDSMVMAEILFRWSRLLKVQLHVAHIHHGSSSSRGQKSFRLRAQKLVGEWCESRKIPFVTNEPEAVMLNSEADLRDYRQGYLKAWAKDRGAKFILFAHHRDDLLETRLLRLIRGTGGTGLRAMTLKQSGKLRPLLQCSRAELEIYAKNRGVKFCEDPSNKTSGPLRNWLRREWLPALEQKRPGSAAALARSLDILSANAVVESKAVVGLRREEIIRYSVPEREKFVAEYLRGLGLKNYGRSHVREILKRIDSPRKNPTFRMLGVVFQVTPDLFWATRV